MTSDNKFVRLERMFYHQVTNPVDIQMMEVIRIRYVTLGMETLDLLPECTSKEEAISLLELSLMRAIQCIALKGEMVIPESLRDGIE